MPELYEKGEPIEPELGMTLGEFSNTLTKQKHSVYVKALCAKKHMNELRSVDGCSSKFCRHYVCPNHESNKSQSKSIFTQYCSVELKLTLKKKKWTVVTVCWEHADFCEHGKGIKKPSTEGMEWILRFKIGVNETKSSTEMIKILQTSGVDIEDPEDKGVKRRMKVAMKNFIRKSSTPSSATSLSLGGDKEVFLFRYFILM